MREVQTTLAFDFWPWKPSFSCAHWRDWWVLMVIRQMCWRTNNLNR